MPSKIFRYQLNRAQPARCYAGDFLRIKLMKALLLAFIAAGALSVGLLSTNANAQQLQLGVNMGHSYGDGNHNGQGQWHHRHHNRCHMMKVWHHHHPVWIQQCGW